MISCRSSLFLVADVLFGRVGTGGVESDEREIQERASEITGSLPLILIPSYILGWRDQACGEGGSRELKRYGQTDGNLMIEPVRSPALRVHGYRARPVPWLFSENDGY